MKAKLAAASTSRQEVGGPGLWSRARSPAARMVAAASPSRQELVCIAQLSEMTQRYSDMLQAMSSVVNLDTELTLLERSLFSRAYNSVIDERCRTLDIVISFELQERKLGNLRTENAAKEFRLRVEAEMEEACYLVINIIDKHLLRVSSSSAENLVFYHQMKGNSYKTLALVKDLTLGLEKVIKPGTFAELKIKSERKETSEQSLQAYTVASEIALVSLCPTNPTRLALALNVSDFFYRLLHSHETAHQVVKQALDAAESELVSLHEESKEPGVQTKDFMGLLRDRLALWNSEKENDDDKGTEIGHKNPEESFKAYEMPMDDGVTEQEEKPEEADPLLGLCDEDEEIYQTARYMSGKNMNTAQKMLWWAIDRYRP